MTADIEHCRTRQYATISLHMTDERPPKMNIALV